MRFGDIVKPISTLVSSFKSTFGVDGQVARVGATYIVYADVDMDSDDEALLGSLIDKAEVRYICQDPPPRLSGDVVTPTLIIKSTATPGCFIIIGDRRTIQANTPLL